MTFSQSDHTVASLFLHSMRSMSRKAALDLSTPLFDHCCAGALEYGCNPDLIHARCSRLAYGVRTCRRALPGDPRSLQFIHKRELVPYTAKVFEGYVERGQVVEVNDVVEHSFQPLYDDQTGVKFKLLATVNNRARFTTDADMQELASLRVELPPGYSRHDYSFTVRLKFGRTELSMVAVDDHTGKELRTTTKFAHSRVPLR
jgi:hypothetical protein